MQPDVWVPSQTRLLQLFGLVFLEHSRVKPEADLAELQVEHDADGPLGSGQELLGDSVELSDLSWIKSHSEI